MDNLTEEFNWLLRKLTIAKFPNWFGMSAKNSAGGKQSKARKKALASLTRPTYEKIIQRFSDDFKFFNFSIPKFEDLSNFLDS